MKIAIVGAFLLFNTIGSGQVFAETPAQPPSPESAETIVDWRNLEGAVSRLIQANETKAAALVKAQQDATALADYWNKYVAGLAHK